jgi:alkylation response protein AidB-like acyl-CoA dehydrogenase
MARWRCGVPEGPAGRVDGMLAWLRRYAQHRQLSSPNMRADLGRAGYFGLQVSEEDGGSALSHRELVRVLQQLGAVDLSLGATVAVHNCLGLRPLLQFGPRALQRQLLARLAGGPQTAAYALAEPGGGANPAAMRTRARRVDGGWRLRGLKDPVALASTSALLTVLAKACDGDGTPLGPIALLVHGDADGVVHERPVATLGLCGMVQHAVGFDNVFVPDTHVLLEPGEGMRVARDAAAFAQLGLGALCTGAIKRCGQLMVQVATQREIATGRLLDNPVTCARLHELACAAWSLDALANAIAAALDGRGAMPVHACVALKCAGTELLWEVADRLLQLCGSDGNLDSAPAATMLRDARALRLMEGSTESLFMQLGVAAAPASGAEHFLAAGLDQAALAKELGGTVAAIRARAGATRAFATESAAVQWLDHRIGELCAWAVLLGAAQGRAAHEPGADALAATAWARGRFDAVRRAVEAAQAEGCVVAPPALLERRIGAFAEAIGTPGLPGQAE